jgi:hypothetical protein
MRADSAVEPTRSENITAAWRRSAAMSLVSAGAVEDISEGVGSGFVPERKPSIASSSFPIGRMRRPRGERCVAAAGGGCLLLQIRQLLSHRGVFLLHRQRATLRPSTTSIGRSDRQAQKGALLVRQDKHHHDTIQSITTGGSDECGSP